mgnify:CR=1 FL=1
MMSTTRGNDGRVTPGGWVTAAGRGLAAVTAGLMLALTFSTGIVDAVGFIGLNQVFSGNMTGNVAILAMAVMFAGLMRHFMPPPRDDGIAARVNAEAGYIGTALFLGAVFAVPLRCRGRGCWRVRRCTEVRRSTQPDRIT